MNRDRMNRLLSLSTALWTAVAMMGLAGEEEIRAEVRSCTLGIDTNCPSGLSE